MSVEDIALIEKAVQGALEQLEKNASEEFAKLKADPLKKEALTESARAAATEQVKLSKEFSGRPDNIADRLAIYLPENRIKMIREGLDFPTFRMEIIKKSDGKHWVEMTRQGKLMEHGSRALVQSTDIDWSKLKQYASIIVEGILLVMSAVGISVTPSERAIDTAIDETVQVIKSSSKLQKALDEFVTAWNNAGGSAYQKAKALFLLIKASNSAGILWNVIKAVCSNMAWYDWLETAAKVSAMIIAALATEGVALIAEIALVVLAAVDFARKIANLNQLETIKGTL